MGEGRMDGGDKWAAGGWLYLSTVLFGALMSPTNVSKRPK